MLKKISNKVKQFSAYLNKEDAKGLELFLQMVGIMFLMGVIAGLFIAIGLVTGMNVLSSIF